MKLKAGILTIFIIILMLWGLNLLSFQSVKLSFFSSEVTDTISNNEIVDLDKKVAIPSSIEKKKNQVKKRKTTTNAVVFEPKKELPPAYFSSFSINSTIKKFIVRKSLQKMYVYFADTFKVFNISLGQSPKGHKTTQGDKKTPEGTYSISFKNPKSRGYKSLKISYPSDKDRAYSHAQGLNPGGDIFIHGLWWGTQDPFTHWKDNWTNGCIAVNNKEIDEIYKFTDVHTVISIYP